MEAGPERDVQYLLYDDAGVERLLCGTGYLLADGYTVRRRNL